MLLCLGDFVTVTLSPRGRPRVPINIFAIIRHKTAVQTLPGPVEPAGLSQAYHEIVSDSYTELWGEEYSSLQSCSDNSADIGATCLKNGAQNVAVQRFY